MVYIPIDWLKNKANGNKVYEILEKLDTDIKYEGCYSEDNAIKELQEIGETLIIEKLQKGMFSFGA